VDSILESPVLENKASAGRPSILSVVIANDWFAVADSNLAHVGNVLLFCRELVRNFGILILQLIDVKEDSADGMLLFKVFPGGLPTCGTFQEEVVLRVLHLTDESDAAQALLALRSVS
jgi:hypothetical protein